MTCGTILIEIDIVAELRLHLSHDQHSLVILESEEQCQNRSGIDLQN
jgi:hypothetical protein